MNSIQNEAQISYKSSGITKNVTTPEVNTSIVDPEIHIVKSCCTDTANRGDEIRYTISVINSGDIATGGNIVIKDYLDKGGTHLNKEHVIRNNLSLQKATSKEVLTRSTYWYEYTEEGHYNEVIAVVNFVRHTNTIEQIVERIKMDLEAANTLYDQLDARYNRLVAIKQDVLSAIGKLSSLSSKQQKELMKATVLALLNDFNSSLTLAYDAIIDYLFQMRKKK